MHIQILPESSRSRVNPDWKPSEGCKRVANVSKPGPPINCMSMMESIANTTTHTDISVQKHNRFVLETEDIMFPTTILKQPGGGADVAPLDAETQIQFDSDHKYGRRQRTEVCAARAASAH